MGPSALVTDLAMRLATCPLARYGAVRHWQSLGSRLAALRSLVLPVLRSLVQLCRPRSGLPPHACPYLLAPAISTLPQSQAGRARGGRPSCKWSTSWVSGCSRRRKPANGTAVPGADPDLVRRMRVAVSVLREWVNKGKA